MTTKNHKTVHIVVRRFRLTQKEAKQVLSIVGPQSIDREDAEQTCSPELFRAFMKGGYFTEKTWNQTVWMQTEFIVVSTVTVRNRLEKCVEQREKDVPHDWWLEHLLSQVQNQAPPQQAGKYQLHRVLNLTLDEAKKLHHLLTQLQSSAFSIQEAKHIASNELLADLIATKWLTHLILQELITIDPDQLETTAFAVHPLMWLDEIPRLVEYKRPQYTNDDWQIRLERSIRKAHKLKRDLAITHFEHKTGFALINELYLTLTEAEQLVQISKPGSNTYELAERFRTHLIEYGYLTQNPGQTCAVLCQSKLNETLLHVLDPHSFLAIRVYSHQHAIQKTPKIWIERLRDTIKRAYKRRLQQTQGERRSVVMERTFFFSLTEARALQALHILTPFTLKELHKTLGKTLINALEENDFINAKNGWINEYRFLCTQFVVQEKAVSDRRIKEIDTDARMEQTDVWWYEHLQQQVYIYDLPKQEMDPDSVKHERVPSMIRACILWQWANGKPFNIYETWRRPKDLCGLSSHQSFQGFVSRLTYDLKTRPAILSAEYANGWTYATYSWLMNPFDLVKECQLDKYGLTKTSVYEIHKRKIQH